MEDKRFEIIYTQGTFNNFRIILDTKTGVQYLHVANGNAGGLTPLLDRDGKPVVGRTYQQD